ncbi:hypothetical protein PG984_007578 [Apiospora sp. TS-2023a]
MATALHTAAGPSVAQKALQDATLAFQGVLSDDQRLMMRLSPVPDPDAILIFTAQLDSINKNRKGRSFATRLHKFLSSIRDFCGIIDTYVSAHPEIAALVWGSVKLTMMVAANFASYYEATSNLFTTLGDLCPLFSEYYVLFYESAGLRDSLDNFYASMICCCRHVVMTMQRSLATQFFKVLQSSFDQEFKPDLEDIQRHARKVKRQIALAKAQADKRFQELQENERVKVSESRAIVERHIARTDCSLDTLQSFQVQSNREKSRKRAKKLLESLSTYNYSRSFKQSTRKRHGNTTNWIHETPQFQRWLEGDSSVVWCSGKIGSGKTIAAASAIKHVQRTDTIANTPPITYLFMQTDEGDSLNVDTVLRTLLRQLLTEAMVSGELGNALHKIVWSWDPSEIANLFLKLMPAPLKAYIFIDGLDECNGENRRLLFEVLSTVVTAAGNIRLYLSSRDSVRNDVAKYFPGFEHISLNCEATRDDIACYINDVIDEKVEEGDLVVGTDELVEEIKSSLANGAQGMYLWAYFQIKEICLQISDEDIRKALKDLPRDLAEVFQRVLRRINVRRRGSVARQVFPWVAAARRPLSIGELREAIAIEIGQQYTEPSKLCNDMEKIPSWCENLIEIDEETGSVQFAHSAVRAFLVDTPSDSTLADFHLDLEVVDHNIGEICVTYLHFNDFKKTLAVRQNPTQINPSLIAPTVLSPVSRGAALISGLIIDLKSTPYSLIDAFSSGNLKLLDMLLKEHMAEHELSKDLINQINQAFRKAVIIGQFDIVDLLLSTQVIDFEVPINSRGTYRALEMALVDHTQLLDSLLAHGGAKNMLGTAVELIYQDWYAKSFTNVRRIRLEVVGKLIAAKTDLNAAGRETMKTALQQATEMGQLNLVAILLSAGADVERKGPTGRGPLHIAAQMGHLEVIKLLLATGADIEAKDSTGQGPLHIAAQMGQLETVKLLLSAGADTEAETSDGFKPLQLASKMGHIRTVKVLLPAETETNAKARSLYSLFTSAISKGQHELEKALITNGPDISANEPSLHTMLDEAARNGSLDLVNLFLESGVNVNSGRLSGALCEAARSGRLEVVKRLLAAGAQVNGSTSDDCRIELPGDHATTVAQTTPISSKGVKLEQTPLYAAATGGDRVDVINVLLDAGADADLSDENFQTLVCVAGRRGRSAVVDRLWDARITAKARQARQSSMNNS